VALGCAAVSTGRSPVRVFDDVVTRGSPPWLRWGSTAGCGGPSPQGLLMCRAQ
jgi:hypothetical protein